MPKAKIDDEVYRAEAVEALCAQIRNPDLMLTEVVADAHCYAVVGPGGMVTARPTGGMTFTITLDARTGHQRGETVYDLDGNPLRRRTV